MQPVRLAASVSETRVSLLTIFCAIAMAVLSFVMQGAIARYPKNVSLHHEISRPILAIELAASKAEMQSTLQCSQRSGLCKQLDGAISGGQVHDDDECIREMFKRNTTLDCFFIFAYNGFLAALMWNLLAGKGRSIGLLFVLATAVFDLAENFRIFAILRSTCDLVQPACWAS